MTAAELPDLLEQVKAFAAARAAFDAGTTAVFASVPLHPADALVEIDALLARLPALEAADHAIRATPGGECLGTIEAGATQWRFQRRMLLGFRWMAARRAGRPEELARTATLSHAAFAAAPDDPFWADIDEHDAELATDTAAREALLDSAFTRRNAAGAYLQAAQNRMRAAALAGDAARFERQRRCADQGIAVANAHGLLREQVAFPISRYEMLLIGDQSGAARDALRRELDFTSRPTGTLADLLERTYAEGLARITAGPDAPATLVAFGLLGEARRLAAATGPALAEARTAAEAALSTQHRGQRLALLLLAAQFKLRLGDPDTPIYDILPGALRLAADPEERCRVHGAEADAWEAKANLPRAIEAASAAAEAVRVSGPATTSAQAEARLATLRTDAGEDVPGGAPDPALDPDDHATRRGQAALAAMSAGNPARAVAILDAALPFARAAAKRAELGMVRGAALYDLDRIAEAHSSLAGAADAFDHAYAEAPGPDGNLLAQRETALMLLAFVEARLSRPLDAWTHAEAARSHLLRGTLGLLPATWEDVRSALAARRASLVEISAWRWGTLVMTAAPGEAEPCVTLLAGFRSTDLSRLIERPELGDDSDAWTDVLMAAIPGLSDGLTLPLSARLAEVGAAADMLYVVADGPLAHAPLAALAVTPLLTLADLAPFSLLPFAGLLAIPDAAPPEHAPAMAAFAVGLDTRGYDFVGHLADLAPILQRFGAETFPGRAATGAALREALASAGLLYLSSHGTLDHATAEFGRASALLLADGRFVSEHAATVAGPGLATATLVFLNACQSGRFRALTRTEWDGFPAACLRAGRRILIAPVTHVDPHAAVALAAAVLDTIHGGMSAARALQAARLKLRAGGAPVAEWASHLMFGVEAMGQ